MRHTDDHGAAGQGGEGLHCLPAAGHQGRAALHAEGHVRAHLRGDIPQLLRAEVCVGQPIQRAQYGRGVRRAAAEPGADGDALFDADIGPPVEPGGGEEGAGGLDGLVFFAGGDVFAVGLRHEIAALAQLYIDLVAEAGALHHHTQLVIAVRPLAQHVQREVELGAGLHRDAAHCWKRRGISSVPELRKGPFSPLASL